MKLSLIATMTHKVNAIDSKTNPIASNRKFQRNDL